MPRPSPLECSAKFRDASQQWMVIWSTIRYCNKRKMDTHKIYIYTRNKSRVVAYSTHLVAHQMCIPFFQHVHGREHYELLAKCETNPREVDSSYHIRTNVNVRRSTNMREWGSEGAIAKDRKAVGGKGEGGLGRSNIQYCSPNLSPQSTHLSRTRMSQP